MKYSIYLSFLSLIILLLFAIPTFGLDLKNILFGGSSSGQGKHDQLTNEQSSFGYRVPPSVTKRQPTSQQSDQVCRGYLCQDTLKCVDEPKLCPCRMEADIKCQVGKDWYTCIRGDQLCEDIVSA